jgi:hypothetical protein
VRRQRRPIRVTGITAPTTESPVGFELYAGFEMTADWRQDANSLERRLPDDRHDGWRARMWRLQRAEQSAGSTG